MARKNNTKNTSTESTAATLDNPSTDATPNTLPAVHDAQGATAPAEKKERQGALGFFLMTFALDENRNPVYDQDGNVRAEMVTPQRFDSQVDATAWLKRNGGALLGSTIHIVRLSASIKLRAPERVVSSVILTK